MTTTTKTATLTIDSTPFVTDDDTGETLDVDVTGPSMAAFEMLLSERVGYPVDVTFTPGAATQTDDDQARRREGLPALDLCSSDDDRREPHRRARRGVAVTAKIIGYKHAAKAMERSRYATTNPLVLALPDGTYVGVGDQHTDGDAMLFGARGTSAWRSEVSL